MCFHLKIKQRLSTAFYSQINSQTERSNQTLEQYLQRYKNYKQDNWVKWLSIAKFVYNNSIHSVTGKTSFYLAYGFYQSMLDTPQFALGINIPSTWEQV